MFSFSKYIDSLLWCGCVVVAGASISLSPSYVFAETDIGTNGAQGADGDPIDTESGEDGGDGQGAFTTSVDPDNTAIAGHGGGGGSGNPGGAGGAGGIASATGSNSATAIGGWGGFGGGNFNGGMADGGLGGDAFATSTGSRSTTANATGGNGGNSDQGNGSAGAARSGANATAIANAVAVSGSGASASATSYGGHGGSGLNTGSGGLAASSAVAVSDFGGPVTVTAKQVQGSGGTGGIDIDDDGSVGGVGNGGNGLDSIMINRVGGYSQNDPILLNSHSIFFVQEAVGGNAGDGSAAADFVIEGEGAVTASSAGVAGNATSTINHISTHEENIYSGISHATGGNGGLTFHAGLSTPGGNATASTTLQADPLVSIYTEVISTSNATGGIGGDNITFQSVSGMAGQGGSADANAFASAINANATATATADGGAGGNADIDGVGGTGGNADADATAISVTGTATADAWGDAGPGGTGVFGGALGGGATATATVKAGNLTLTAYDVASDGGVAHASLSLTAPVNGAGNIPTTIDGTLGYIGIDSNTNTTISYAGILTISAPNGAEIISANADHTLSATSIIFASDVTFTVTDVTDSLTVSGGTTFTSGITFAKAGTGELIFDNDLDITNNDLQVIMESGTFSSADPQISVTGDLDVGSVLDLDLVGSFEPSIGDEFDIIEYTGTLTGIFSTIEFPSVDGLSFGIEYNTGLITLDVVLEGDLNNDGFVGSADLNLVLGNFNQTVDAGVLLQGDPSGDGFVGSVDLNTVLGNWNAGTPPVVGAAIPEPSAIVILGFGGLAIGRRKVNG